MAPGPCCVDFAEIQRKGVITMTNPFDRSAIDDTDDTDDTVIPLKMVGQVYLRALPGVITLRLESPASDTSGEITAEQWGLTRYQAEFLMNSLQDCLKTLPYTKALSYRRRGHHGQNTTASMTIKSFASFYINMPFCPFCTPDQTRHQGPGQTGKSNPLGANLGTIWEQCLLRPPQMRSVTRAAKGRSKAGTRPRHGTKRQ